MYNIRPKIRPLIDLFVLFAHDHLTKIYDHLSFTLSLCTTIQPKIRILINLFFYLWTTIQPKSGVNPTLQLILFLIVPIFCLLYSRQYFSYILFTLFLAILSLYFVQFIHGSAALIFPTPYP